MSAAWWACMGLLGVGLAGFFLWLAEFTDLNDREGR